MVVIILMHVEMPDCVEVQKPFHCLDVLDCVMVELIPKLKNKNPAVRLHELPARPRALKDTTASGVFGRASGGIAAED